MTVSIWMETKVLALKLPLDFCTLGGVELACVRVPFCMHWGYILFMSAVSHMD